MNAIVERYDRDAAAYQRYWAPVLERSSQRILDWVTPHVEKRAGRLRVLEVGVGTGAVLRAALERWPQAEFVATDGARGMLDLARSLTGDEAAGGRLRFVAAPADRLPLADASVDLVISTFVLQLVPNRRAALEEARRVLRPGGQVAYLTWLDREASEPFLPGEQFDEAVFDLGVDEPEYADEPHAGDVRSARAATDELRRAGFGRATATEDVLEYSWTLDSYLDYKLAYDERDLLALLDADQRAELEANARRRLTLLAERAFRWHAPIIFARAERPAD